MSKTIHMRASIKGMLMRSDRELAGVLQDDAGRALRPAEARRMLLDELEQGHLYIKCGPCDNWDPREGCLGHAEKETAA